MNDYTLPQPAEPYDHWAALVSALWDHGSAHPNPAITKKHIGMDLLETLQGTALPRERAEEVVRPSSLLSCARQLYLVVHEGCEVAAPGPDLAPTFGIGHLVEAYGRVYLESALPPGFAVDYGAPMPLPKWWPGDHPLFREQGTNDFRIVVTDPALAALYLNPSQPPKLIGDFKTSASFSYDDYKRASTLATKPDPFGYLCQVTLYGEEQGDCATALALFNRNAPKQGLVVRTVDKGIRAEEAARIQRALMCAFQGIDPGRELHDRWAGAARNGGNPVDFYCGFNGKAGMCPVQAACHAKAPPPAPIEV